jgi:hypothetical protein
LALAVLVHRLVELLALMEHFLLLVDFSVPVAVAVVLLTHITVVPVVQVGVALLLLSLGALVVRLFPK